MRQPISCMFICLVLVGLCGCKSNEKTEAAPAPKLRRVPLSDAQLPTTHHRIWLANHNSRLAAVQSIVDEGTGTPAVHAELAGLYRTRFAVHNDFDDLTRAANASATAVESDDPKADWLLTAADIAMKRHQFSDAKRHLTRAEAAAADATKTTLYRAEVDLAEGRTAAAQQAIRTAATNQPSVHTLARLGVLECKQDLRKAELAFERAEGLITSTNPYTVAWLHSLRGRCLLDAGEPALAMTFLDESVRRLPGLTSAQLFRAEALLAQNDETAAVEIYEKLAARNHPEALAMLATLTSSPRADEWRSRARDAFAALRRDHPELADAHLSGFVAQHTSPARAIELLTAAPTSD